MLLQIRHQVWPTPNIEAILKLRMRGISMLRMCHQSKAALQGQLADYNPFSDVREWLRMAE